MRVESEHLMAGEPQITISGNLSADPELRHSKQGAPWASFDIAATPSTKNQATGQWEDGETIWFRCRAFHKLAENIAATLTKGTRVHATGRLTQRSYEDRNGVKRTSLQLDITDIGPSLKNATAQITRPRPQPANTWPQPAASAPSDADRNTPDSFNNETPF